MMTSAKDTRHHNAIHLLHYMHDNVVINKTVRYDTLKPLAAMREKLLYNPELNEYD